MNKLIIPIIVIAIIAAGIGAYFVLQKPALPQSQPPVFSMQYETEYLHIGEIWKNIQKYQNQTVALRGQYQGWHAEGIENPLITRSDWVIKDDTGSIYVTGGSGGLSPEKDIGIEIIVKGQVLLNKDRMPYVKANEVIKSVTTTSTPKSPEQISKDSPFGFHPGYVFPEDAYKNLPLAPDYFLKVSPSYEYAKDIGVKWERPGIYLSVSPESFENQSWQQSTDKVYSNVPTSMQIFANINVRAWAITKPPSIPDGLSGITVGIQPLTTLELVDEQRYLEFVKELVERYDGDGFNDMPNLKNPIKYWQIDNELPGPPPSGAFSISKPEDKEWLNASINNYAHVLEITSEAIKSADPTAKVAIAGMMGISPEVEEIFKLYYLEVLKKLDGKYIDIFDCHAYGTSHQDWKLSKDLYRIIRRGLNSAGYNNTELWITETGTYNGQPRGMVLQTEKDQAIDLVRRLIYPLTFGVKRVFWAWCVIDDARSEGEDGHMGLVYNGYGPGNPGYGVKKLSYYTYKKMVEVLEGSEWNNIQTIQESDGSYIYKFIKNNKSIWVAWNDNEQEKQIAISDITSSQVKITEAVPKYESGKDVTDYNTAFEVETKIVQNNKISITLGDVPVFVEGK